MHNKNNLNLYQLLIYSLIDILEDKLSIFLQMLFLNDLFTNCLISSFNETFILKYYIIFFYNLKNINIFF
jgi:hypothetical protein